MREGVPFLPACDRLDAFVSLAAYLDSAELGAAIETLIERLDAAAGDPDLEANGDEIDGNGSEDDFISYATNGPGCPVADSDCCAAYDDDLTRGDTDGAPGDPDDAEDGTDREQDDSDREEGPDWKHQVDDANRTTRRPHLEYLRRTRCEKIVHRPIYSGGITWTEYRLKGELMPKIGF